MTRNMNANGKKIDPGIPKKQKRGFIMAKRLPDVTKLSNWEIVSDWCYKYAVSDSLWYELRIVRWKEDTDNEHALADLYECSLAGDNGEKVYTSLKANGRTLPVYNCLRFAGEILSQNGGRARW